MSLEYFQKFPSTSNTINGVTKSLVDISYTYSIDFDEFTKSTTSVAKFNTLANAAVSTYNDAKTFWVLLCVNEEINPWIFVPVDPVTYKDKNYNYSAVTLQYDGTKNDPTTYMDLFPEDIIVNVNGTYNPGITAASSLFNLNLINVWSVQKAFYDTKKAKITPNLNSGYTGYIDLADPDITIAAGSFMALRKGLTGYYLLREVNSTQNPTNLKTYTYLESTVVPIDKTTKYAVSVFEPAGESDSIFNVITDNSPGSTAINVYEQDYKSFTVEEIQQQQYLKNIIKQTIPSEKISKLLSKLI